MTLDGATDIPTLVMLGEQLRLGQPAKTEAMARARLAAFPDEAESYDLLAVSLIARGNLKDAQANLTKAIALKPERASFHRNFGEVCRRLGDREGAIRGHMAAAERGHVSATHDLVLALMLLEAGRADEAKAIIGRVTPADAPTGREGRVFKIELAFVLVSVGQFSDAKPITDELLKLAPNSVTLRLVTLALNSLVTRVPGTGVEAEGQAWAEFTRLLLQADILTRGKKHAAAAAHLRRACELDGSHASLWDMTGTSYFNVPDYENAIAAYDRAILCLPSLAPPHYNRSIPLRQQFMWAEAAESAARAVALDPKNPEFHVGLGLCYHGLGRSADAVVQYEQALVLKPDHHGAMLNLAFPLMRLGQWRRGFEAYEARYKFGDLLRRGERKLSGEWWQGQSLTGKSLFIESEQGLGDTIEFSRFLPRLFDQNPSKVVVEVQPAMAELLRHSFARFGDRLQIINRSREWPSTKGLPETDYYCLLLSLLHHLDITLETLPKTDGYLAASPGLIAAWAPQISRSAPAGNLRVGIAWAGNPQNSFDALRSPGLKPLLPLLDLPGVTFFSLQMKHGPDDKVLADIPKTLVDLGRFIETSSDMAAMMANLDLIISPCTAPLHMAGALGRPAFGILAHVADWRWLIDRADCPWYPTLRLFRQPSRGDWASVISTVKTEIAKFAKEKARRKPASAVSPQSVADISLRLFNAGALVEAEAACREHLAIEASDAAAWRLLGVTVAQQKREAEAITCFEKAIALDPDKSDHYFNLGTALMSLKQDDAALGAYGKAIDRDPTNIGALCNSGSILRQLGRQTEAMAMFERAIKIDPKIVPALYNLGLLAHELGYRDRAKSALTECLKVDPQHHRARSLLHEINQL